MTARTPLDLVALVPILLGFAPADSLVLLCFGPGAFHARVDLAGSAPDELIEVLLAPAVRHRVRRVALLCYTDDPELAELLGHRAVARFTDREIGVVDVLRVHQDRWWSALDDPTGPGTSFDLRAHPFTARAVFEGRRTLPSRAALADTLAPDPDAATAVRAQLCYLAGERPDRGDQYRWIEGFVAHHLDGASLQPVDVARVLTAFTDPLVRDQATLGLTRENAERHRQLWTRVLQMAPPGHQAEPAALVALTSWLHGDGALAWCALDRCLSEQPRHRLGGLIARVLTEAVPPRAWRGPVPGRAGDLPQRGSHP